MCPSLKLLEFVNKKDDIPNMKWKIANVWNHQLDKLPRGIPNLNYRWLCSVQKIMSSQVR